MPATSVLESVELFDKLIALRSSHPYHELKGTLVQKNEKIFLSGAQSTGMYVVIQGAVKIFKTAVDGKERVIDVLTRGDFFGEMAMLLGTPHFITAESVVDSVILHIPEKQMLAFIDESPALCKKLLGMMSKRLHQLMLDIESTTFKSGHQRVADYILSLPAKNPRNGDGFTIRLSTKKIDLASRLDLSPQHFSRILQDFIKQGLISVDGANIDVPSADKLRGGRMKFE